MPESDKTVHRSLADAEKVYGVIIQPDDALVANSERVAIEADVRSLCFKLRMQAAQGDEATLRRIQRRLTSLLRDVQETNHGE